MTRSVPILATLLLAAVLVATGAAAQEASLMTFPGTFAPRGVNMDGSIVFGNGTIPDAPEAPAYRWNNGAYRTLPLAVYSTAVNGTHYLGAGTFNGLPGTFRVIVNPGGIQVQRLVDLVSDPGTATGYPSITPDGSAVYGATPNPGGGMGTHDATQAAVWTAGGPPTERLPPPDDGECASWASTGSWGATDTDVFGEALLFTCDPGFPGVFRVVHTRWPGPMDAPNPLTIRASGNGALVAVYNSEGVTFFRGSSAITPPPTAQGCQFNQFSYDGSVAVGGACVWRADLGWVPLLDFLGDRGVDVSGWTAARVDVVSGDGSVVAGWGERNGAGVGFRAVIGTPAASDLVVNSTDDDADETAGGGTCDTGDDIEIDGETVDECTLRAAIQTANVRGGGTISFDIPGGGVPRIDVPVVEQADALPAFTAPIVLDGTTQPGGWVEIVGPGFVSPHLSEAGIRIEAGGDSSEVHGLVVHGFQGSDLQVNGADGCLIEGNRIGTDVTGTQAVGNPLAFLSGVRVLGNHNRLVNNVFAGHAWPDGEGGLEVSIFGNENVLEGNRIGVGADGLVVALPPVSRSIDGYTGILIQGDRNVVGAAATVVPQGTCMRPCNLIAGFEVAVSLGGGRGANPGGGVDNVVAGNWIGVDANGTPTNARQNGSSGVQDWTEDVHGSIIAYNLIYAEINAVYARFGARVTGNLIEGREEGFDTNQSVNAALVAIHGSGAEFRGNTVRSHSSRGVVVDGSGNTLAQNTVTDNPLGGIVVSSGTGHVIADNDIYDNGFAGIAVSDLFEPAPLVVLVRNRIYGNAIGIDLAFNAAIVPAPPWGSGLGSDGVTQNDFNDGDDGPNGLLNFPQVLSSTYDGTTLTVHGFVEAPVFDTAPYFVEAFTGPECSADEAAFLGGQAYGQGEHYLGIGGGNADDGYADFTLALTDVPAGDAYVSLTATRLDLGATSEFSRCLPLVSPEQTAQASIAAGQSGPVLDGQGTTVAIASARARGTADASQHDGGTLYLTRYEARPDTSVFADASAPGPGGTDIHPDAVAARYWLLADRGLTSGGGATSAPATFAVCLDPTGVVLPGALASVVVVRRDEATGGVWVPYPTTSTPHGDTSYLCADGLTALGDFGIGGAQAAFPVGVEDGPVASPDRPTAFALVASPNPVRGAAAVRVSVPEAQRVAVAVFDLLGRRVAVLHDGELAAGEHSLRLDARRLPGGVYVVRAVGATATQTQRITVIP